MTLKDFIKENKEELDRCIRRACPNCRLNYDERRLWILNDEGLYRWARSEGVRV
jgi:heterodisulfide reductase subunit B